MVAANKAELSNVAIVISDLGASAYHAGGVGVMAALSGLEKETNRSALIIEPVATQGARDGAYQREPRDPRR